jgi:hypothetical protein
MEKMCREGCRFLCLPGFQEVPSIACAAVENMVTYPFRHKINKMGLCNCKLFLNLSCGTLVEANLNVLLELVLQRKLSVVDQDRDVFHHTYIP